MHGMAAHRGIISDGVSENWFANPHDQEVQ